MAALSSKLLLLARFERSKMRPRLNPQPLLVQVKNTISFLSRSKKEEKPVEKDVEGRIIVDPDVVIDSDDKHLVHKEYPLVEVEQKKVYTEEEIEALQNKSRLKRHHYRMLHGKHPHETSRFWTHKTVKYQRRMFGRYGEASGVNPRICWPLESELKIRLEYESIAHPFSFHELVDRIKAKRKAEQDEMERRANEVEANMAKAEKAKEDYLARVGLKEKDAQEAAERKEKLMEEVRRHFGYKVDVRDERFQEMLEKKEKEQRKARKEARKLARAQEQLRKLNEMGQQAKIIATAEKTAAEIQAKKEEADEDSDDEDKPEANKK